MTGTEPFENTLLLNYTGTSTIGNYRPALRIDGSGYVVKGQAGSVTGIEVDLSGATAPTKYAAVFKGGNVGIGTTTPGFPLTFPNTLGDKISLWGQSDNHYGFGIQAGTLQIHTDSAAADIVSPSPEN